jgi:poly(3-hydroxybutyrate) depolymerase
MLRRGLAVLYAIALVPAAAHADAKAPCADCILELPRPAAELDGKKPLPLLVLLHGDGERASYVASKWRAAARERGWVLFAPQCPTAEGCGTSWWKWDGDPAWLEGQVGKVRDAVKAAKLAIDPASIALVGWSGGATYWGRRAAALRIFSVAIAHGGGDSPSSNACPSPALAAYFLVGDRNPLHGLAKDLRTYLDGCKQHVTWDLVAGADHDKEDRALDKKKALTILDWAASRARTSAPR